MMLFMAATLLYTECHEEDPMESLGLTRSGMLMLEPLALTMSGMLERLPHLRVRGSGMLERLPHLRFRVVPASDIADAGASSTAGFVDETDAGEPIVAGKGGGGGGTTA